jgi:signal peptidase II
MENQEIYQNESESLIIPVREKKIWVFFAIAIALVILDQITKLWIHGFSFLGFNHIGFDYGSIMPVIGNFVTFTFIENPGMAWGIHFGFIGKFLLSSFSIIASIVLSIVLIRIRNKHFGVRLAIMFILAGAFGNLIDRVFYGVIFGYAPLLYGKVVDFIQVDIPDIVIGSYQLTHFPVFNVADSCVTIGICILVIFFNKVPQINEIFPKKIKNVASEQVNESQSSEN